MADAEETTANEAIVEQSSETGPSDTLPAARPFCGMVRPIADMGDYGAKHWLDVHAIVKEAASEAGYELRLVSESDSVGIILNDIVSNLYKDPIVICDVSGRNPNVMFEVGMRIAFEKPTIIITDDATPFSFDISPLKHIPYPRSLRYGDMQSFKRAVTTAIPATIKQAESGRGYLQQFGDIRVTAIGTEMVGLEELAKEFKDLRRSVQGAIAAASARQAGSPNEGRSGWSNENINPSALSDIESRLSNFIVIDMGRVAANNFMGMVNLRFATSVAQRDSGVPGRVHVEVTSATAIPVAEVLSIAISYDTSARLMHVRPVF